MDDTKLYTPIEQEDASDFELSQKKRLNRMQSLFPNMSRTQEEQELFNYNEDALQAAKDADVQKGIEIMEQYMPKQEEPMMSQMSEAQKQEGIKMPEPKAPVISQPKAPIAKAEEPISAPSPVETAPQAEQEDAGIAALKKSQEERDRLLNQYGMLAAGRDAIIAGAGIGGADFDRYTKDSSYLNLLKQKAENKVGDVKDIAKEEKAITQHKAAKLELEQKGIDLANNKEFQNPNSAISKAYRDSLAKIDPSVMNQDFFKNASAYQIKAVYPMIDDMLDRKARAEERSLLKEAKEDAAIEKAKVDLHKALDPDEYRAGNFANNKKIYDRAERIVAMVKGKRPEDLTEQQIFELARGLEGVIAGGVGTITGAMHLLPKNLQTGLVGVEQWITSRPPRAKLAEFARMLTDAVVREQRTTFKAIQDTQSKRIQSPKFKKLMEKAPEEFEDQVAIWGFDAKGKPTASVEELVPHPFGEEWNPKGSKKSDIKAPASMGDMVSVISPSGQKGKIPRANLEKALAAGYKQVQ